MRLNTEWVEKMWYNWALYHLENLSQDEMGSEYELFSEFTTMSVLQYVCELIVAVFSCWL